MTQTQEDKVMLNSIYKLAKMGHLGAVQYLKDRFNLKVYTQEEIDILNKQTTLDLTKENLI